MAIRRSTFEGTFGVSLIVSTVIHLAVFLLLIWSGRLFPVTTSVQETYYVDVVNLPVASPRAGSPTQKGDDLEAPSPPALEKSMTLPVPQKPETRQKPQPLKKPTEKGKSVAESDAFAEKMAKLQGKTEAQQQQATLERLRRKVAATGSGRSGMPGAGGTEAGSRYEDYLKSRLEDALKKTSMLTTANPVVDVHLTIGANGQITRQEFERSTGDHAFERAVQRAIELVGETLKPPPNHMVFEGYFRFMPRQITKNKP
ncbi:MAG: cell envelope integrity protein TolA [Desulfuromonadales bacterium]|nr:cell envelope integrity protein TolA [Desulfuromonadales bacterium]